ncbi:cytidylyltransferase domain-containing protein [Salegentibacter salegens]
MSSSRLPGKSLMKIGPQPLIWYVVNRLKRLSSN